MLNRFVPALGTLGAAALLATMAQAQDVDADLMALGEDIYGNSCAQCHRSEGQGTPPSFPALAGNDFLEDVEAVAVIIHEGREAMPSHTQFDAEQVAAVSTYIRNSWGNEFGGVDVDEVAAYIDEEVEVMRVSVWDGIYTDEQAERGEGFYRASCSQCHGIRLDGAAEDPDMRGSPPVARARLIRSWEDQSLASLFEYTRGSMPEQNPGSMNNEQIADILAYMFQVSNMPSGDEELSADPSDLVNIVIEYDPR